MATDTKLVVVGIAVGGVAAIGFLAWLVAGDRDCSSHQDAEARVAALSTSLQQSAARGDISIERLAGGLKQMNAAATAYEATKDHQVYCDALDKMRDDFSASK